MSNDPNFLSPDEVESAEPPPIEMVEVLGRSDIAGQATDEGKGRIFPCDSCGADMLFHIGQQQLQCPFCGHLKQIVIDEQAEIREQDFHAMLERLQTLEAKGVDLQIPDQSEVRCESCGGTVLFSGTLTSSECPYCGSPIQLNKVHSATQRIPVDAVLPFLVDHQQATQRLREWVESRWFAPNEFRRRGVEGKFNGIYLPYWTFDSLTFTAYTGQRGENYTVTVGSGKNQRTETRTRWYPASGRFQRFFDDVLVVASQGLPEKYLLELEPWPLAKCLPFTQQVLAGYMARTYDVELPDGFRIGKQRIDDALLSDVRRRIGGDKQRVDSVKSRYDEVTYKHLLLPVWMLAYRYSEKPYQVFINAATGEVQGERPYSVIKIVLTVLGVIGLIGGVVAITSAH